MNQNIWNRHVRFHEAFLIHSVLLKPPVSQVEGEDNVENYIDTVDISVNLFLQLKPIMILSLGRSRDRTRQTYLQWPLSDSYCYLGLYILQMNKNRSENNWDMWITLENVSVLCDYFIVKCSDGKPSRDTIVHLKTKRFSI